MRHEAEGRRSKWTARDCWETLGAEVSRKEQKILQKDDKSSHCCGTMNSLGF